MDGGYSARKGRRVSAEHRLERAGDHVVVHLEPGRDSAPAQGQSVLAGAHRPSAGRSTNRLRRRRARHDGYRKSCESPRSSWTFAPSVLACDPAGSCVVDAPSRRSRSGDGCCRSNRIVYRGGRACRGLVCACGGPRGLVSSRAARRRYCSGLVEMRDGAGIGVDREDDAMFAGAAYQFVAEVQPVAEGVDFQGGVHNTFR